MWHIQMVLAGLIVLASSIYFLRLLVLTNPLGFSKMDKLSQEEILISVKEMAREDMGYKQKGRGISIARLKKIYQEGYNRILEKVEQKEEIYDFEHWFYDNYYKLARSLQGLRSFGKYSKRLTSVEGRPRIYRLLEFIVKSSNGLICELEQIIQCYNKENPLLYRDIMALPKALELAILEHIAIQIEAGKKVYISEEKAASDAKQNAIDKRKLNDDVYIIALYDKVVGEFKQHIASLCLENGNSLEERRQLVNAKITSLNLSVSLSIRTFFDKLDKLTEQKVLSLYGGYNMLEERLSVQTKRQYLGIVEKEAKRRKVYELTVLEEKIKEAGERDLSLVLLKKEKPKALARFIFFISLVIPLGLAAVLGVFSPVFPIAMSLLSAPIFIVVFYSLFNFILNRTAGQQLPFYSEDSLSQEDSTVIVVPRLIVETREVEEAFMHIETQIFANPDKIFSYSLLFDFCDSLEVFNENDKKLIDAITKRFLVSTVKERLSVLVRRREKIPFAKKYGGLEKKRGALISFNKLLLNKKSEEFLLRLGRLPSAKYAITLDCDTQIINAKRLVATISHPYCQKTAVLSIGINSNLEEDKTSLFSRLFRGSEGLDRYSSVAASFHNSLFGVGNFTGKGIYKVAEFHKKTGDEFLEQRILCHDFLEGAVAGCRNSDVTALDEYPKTFSSFLSRETRWQRGDIQLLPFLLPRYRKKDGTKTKNKIHPIAKLTILQNILRPLCSIFSLSLIILALFAYSPLLILLVAFAPYMMSVFLSILSSPRAILPTICRNLFLIGVMPVLAFHAIFAFFVTIFRLMRRRKLLEWRTFMHSSKRIILWPNVLFAAVIITLNILFAFSIALFVIAGIFILGLFFELILSKRIILKPRLSKKESLFLEKVFIRTYKYFEKGHLEKYNYLIPDNIQHKDGQKKLAKRTSPTNIGFSIIAHIAAYLKNLIDKELFEKRVGQILSTVERLEKWHGNLYNWYDIETLKVLPTRFVSSVDSGNFLVGLLLLKAVVGEKLFLRCNSLIEATKIEKLYNPEKDLFSIGFNCAENSLDNSHYDLFASEALLTYLACSGLQKIPFKSINSLSIDSLRFENITSLASWTGGAFEYLMPSLFFSALKGSLYHKSTLGAIRSQIRFSKRQRHKVFGISEAQYDRVDSENNYQYKAQGIPNIALSNQECSSTISPYASILGLYYAPKAVIKNLHRLDKLKMLADYGYFEAIDLSKKLVIKTYMAHHQGMILAAIANMTDKNLLVEKLKQLPECRAASLYLTMKARLRPRKKEKDCPKIETQTAEEKPIISKGNYSIPRVNFLQSESTCASISDNGRQRLLFKNLTLEREGARELLVNVSGEIYNLLLGEFIHEKNKTTIRSNFEKFNSEVIISTLPFGIVYQVSLINKIANNFNAELITKIEPTINPQAADISHRTYQDMFLRFREVKNFEALICSRVPKEELFLTHFLVGLPATVNNCRQGYYKRGSEVKKVSLSPTEPVISTHSKVVIEPLKTKTIEVFTLFSKDTEKLEALIKRVKTEAQFTQRFSQEFNFSKKNTLDNKFKDIGAKILYAPQNIGKVDKLFARPVVALELINIASLKQELAELKKLYLHGLVFDTYIVFNERHSYFLKTREAIFETLDELSFMQNIFTPSKLHLINENEEPNLASEVLKANILQFGEKNHLTKKPPPTSSPIASNHTLCAMPSLPPHPSPLIPSPYKIQPDYAYFVDLTNQDTPKPHSTVIANPHFGTIITESGGGYSFYNNSYYKKISHLSFDSILDPPSEYIELVCGSEKWGATKKPNKVSAEYTATLALGYAKFTSLYKDIKAKQTVFIDKDAPTKYFILELENHGERERRISVSFLIKAVLGDFYENTKHALRVERIDNSLKIENLYTNLSVYLHTSEAIKTIETRKNGEFSPKVSLQDFVLGSEKKTIYFALSQEKAVDFSLALDKLGEAKNYYSNLSVIDIKGYSDTAVLAKWLPYQTLCSRFFAKAGFYQAGGAVGFRDQLQDCLGLLYIDPSLVRAHIIECAKRQFEKGDVLHWWHEPNTGVRTKMTDDRLFLPLVVAEYISFTGDIEILNETASFLADEKIEEGKHDLYKDFSPLLRRATILEHCIKAIEVSLDFGDNGLNKIGTGDWNDALDRLGEKGKGTSTFVSMLLYAVIKKFSKFIKDLELKTTLLDIADDLKKIVDSCFFTDRYIRAVTDDGVILGEQNSLECKIDMLSQSWAVLSGIGDKEKRKKALKTVERELVDYKVGIAKLLAPPFEKMTSVGYIADYPKGVRENGGQYTHAACWYILALIEEDEIELAYKIFEMLNPLAKTKSLQGYLTYKTEPFVLTGDVYTNGQGGWSFYTGAASWYYKALVEGFLGLKIKGRKIYISPKLPNKIDEFSFSIRNELGEFNFRIDNRRKEGAWKLSLGRLQYSSDGLELTEFFLGKELLLHRVPTAHK